MGDTNAAETADRAKAADDDDATEAADAGELSRRIHSLYGEVDWTRAKGVLHVAAVHGRPAVVIALGPSAPASPVDRFVLGLARARADAIVTSGSILRSEPDLVHRYAESDAQQAVFASWRRDVLGRHEPPSLVVLSGSGEFPTDHPALAAARGGFVWTSPEGRDRIGSALHGALSVEVPDCAEGSLAESVRRALEHARAVQGAQTILIEAGPTIAATLYPSATLDPVATPRAEDRPCADLARPEAGRASGDPAQVDELLLSRFEGELDAEAVGPAFVSEERIAERLGPARTTVSVRESSGPWRFERYRVEG